MTIPSGSPPSYKGTHWISLPSHFYERAVLVRLGGPSELNRTPQPLVKRALPLRDEDGLVSRAPSHLFAENVGALQKRYSPYAQTVIGNGSLGIEEEIFREVFSLFQSNGRAEKLRDFSFYEGKSKKEKIFQYRVFSNDTSWEKMYEQLFETLGDKSAPSFLLEVYLQIWRSMEKRGHCLPIEEKLWFSLSFANRLIDLFSKSSTLSINTTSSQRKKSYRLFLEICRFVDESLRLNEGDCDPRIIQQWCGRSSRCLLSLFGAVDGEMMRTHEQRQNIQSLWEMARKTAQNQNSYMNAEMIVNYIKVFSLDSEGEIRVNALNEYIHSLSGSPKECISKNLSWVHQFITNLFLQNKDKRPLLDILESAISKNLC